MTSARPHAGGRARTAAALLLVLHGLACAARPHVAAPSVVSAAAPARVALPEDWADRPPSTFERWLEASFPDGGSAALEDGALEALEAALAGEGRAAERAAIVLGRSDDPRAPALLAGRLEARLLGERRSSDVPDVVALRALLARGLDESTREALAALALGPAPHPDLEVRVECAAAVLLEGDDAVVPLLVEVLRLGTPESRAEAYGLVDSPTTAWARGRAAAVLARRASVPSPYRADASLADRARAIAELETALRAAGAL